ncbi:virion structural protein [Cyanophage S-RIM32]|uniref:Virion structural protein n=1 Tax=Cyanophage S-RIM32 TaxID=1278479 RepID=A0A127KMM0_9CAUD|nr:virion structural protein [Cyanophage S-RIM32]AMO43221.1 virion structural protein [Cyanophage S-RIM32]
MADRFPLIVNATSRKIEELVAGDNLDLTGNGVVISGDTGDGKYLKSDGGFVVWDNPGDVYLTATQTLKNKTFETCTISGSLNTITNIPNSGLVNSGITINGSTVALGASITTPNDNTTYTVNAVDGLTDTQKIIRLTDSSTNTDDVIFSVGTPASIPVGSNALSLFLTRNGDNITLSGTVVDNNTVTTVQAFTGGTAQSGAIILKGSGGATISQDVQTKTITIDTRNDDTITQLRTGLAGVYADGDFTFLQGGATTVSQAPNGTTGDPEITISSSDTVTRVRGGSTSSFLPSTTGTSNTDVTFIGGTHRDSSVSVVQNGNNIEIDAFNTDTVTRIGSVASNGTFAVAAGDFRFTSSGDVDLTQTTNSGVTEIDISFTNTDTGAGLGANNGLILSGSNFGLKNAGSLTDSKLVKWDSANTQLVNSLIEDNGTTVTIGGNLNVTGTTTTLESTVLQVKDPIIELRKGAGLVGADGGIQINRTSNSESVVQTWIQLQWYETGGYFRTLDNSGVAKRLVTESESQTLTNKTLSGAQFTGTTNIGVVTNTSINGLSITPCISSTFDIADSKTLTVNNTLTFSGTDGSNVNFANGGGAGAQVAYSSNNLGDFATTTSVQLRGTLSDPTGSGSCVFNTLPTFITGILTQNTSFSLINTNATTVNAFGEATTINIGEETGTTNIKHDLDVDGNVTLNTNDTDTFTVNGLVNFENNDIKIRGSDANAMTLGRGNGAVSSNTALGAGVLAVNQSGSQNVGVGFEALASNVAGLGNVAIGDGALSSSDVGSNNVAIGKDAALASTGGDHNIAIGNSAMYNAITANDNICIGDFAGYNMSGSGNVLIGSGRIIDQLAGSTYQPPSPAGSVQLVIGSTTEIAGTRYSGTWIKGDINFNVSMENNLSVGGELIVDGNLTVNGTTTTINTQNIQIDDNAIELAAVQLAEFSGNVTNGSPFVTNVEVLTGVIPGMVVNVISGTSLPVGTTTVTSVDIDNGVVGLSQNITSSGGVGVFEALGPTDEAANGGGLILKGTTTDKTILYDNTRADKYWKFSENLELRANRHIAINNAILLSGTTLGTTVVNSSLTSVGTLNGLTVSGAASFGGRIKESNDNNFGTSLAPNGSGVLTINTATSNTICGTPTSAPIDKWAFTNVSLNNGESFTLTLILASNINALYGDACSVDGSDITNGVKWSGGSPPTPTNNTDILTFIIVKDGSGTIQVFGQGNTDFS